MATSTTLLLIESQQKKYEFNGNKDHISINVETIKQDELFHNDHKVKKGKLCEGKIVSIQYTHQTIKFYCITSQV